MFASPLAKKLASEKGIELTVIRGTGPHNRIIAADVEEYVPGETKSVCHLAVSAERASARIFSQPWLSGDNLPAAVDGAVASPVASSTVGATEFTDLETSTIRKVFLSSTDTLHIL